MAAGKDSSLTRFSMFRCAKLELSCSIFKSHLVGLR
jgi:hypothetical protein